ncbi:hypothetical protein [Vibrio sp. M260112]|uniref:hypothetical protein n=1 Tax=Vibrio sp. M260112 TaxID=3020895 RepID=UPI002F3F031C
MYTTLTNNQTSKEYTRYQIEDEVTKYGVSCHVAKPFEFNDVQKKLGYKTSLLMLSMARNPHVSASGLKDIIDISSYFTNYPSFRVVSLNTQKTYPQFTIETNEEDGIFKDDLAAYPKITHFFRIIPELKIPKTTLGIDSNSTYELDLVIELILNLDGAEHTLASVVVECDGPTHLESDKVRADKLRDSHIQSLAFTVFRIQSVNTHCYTIKVQREKTYQELMAHIRNIQEHFRNRLFAYLSSAPHLFRAIQP